MFRIRDKRSLCTYCCPLCDELGGWSWSVSVRFVNLKVNLTRIFYCRIMVRLGELDVRTERDCNADGSSCIEAQDFEIDKITAHSMYDTPKYANDIALIRLKRMTNSSKEIGYNLISQKKNTDMFLSSFHKPIMSARRQISSPWWEPHRNTRDNRWMGFNDSRYDHVWFIAWYFFKSSRQTQSICWNIHTLKLLSIPNTLYLFYR